MTNKEKIAIIEEAEGHLNEAETMLKVALPALEAFCKRESQIAQLASRHTLLIAKNDSGWSILIGGTSIRVVSEPSLGRAIEQLTDKYIAAGNKL